MNILEEKFFSFIDIAELLKTVQESLTWKETILFLIIFKNF